MGRILGSERLSDNAGKDYLLPYHLALVFSLNEAVVGRSEAEQGRRVPVRTPKKAEQVIPPPDEVEALVRRGAVCKKETY